MLPVALKPKTKGRNSKYEHVNKYLYDRKARERTLDFYLDKPWKKLMAYVLFFSIFGSMFLLVIRSQKQTPTEYVLDV